MWIVELSFTGTPERLAARPTHREKSAALHEGGRLRMAGPLADDSGAVLVLDVADRAALDRQPGEDPYDSTEGVRVEQLREWRPFLG